MNEANLNMLKKQFVFISQQLDNVSGVERSNMLINACEALISVACADIKASEHSESDEKDIIVSVGALGDKISELCGISKENMHEVSGLKAIEDLKNAQEEAKRLEKECQDAQLALPNLKAENEKNTIKAGSLKVAYEAQERLRDRLKEDIDNYSDANRKVIEDEIENLKVDLATLKGKYTDKLNEKTQQEILVEKEQGKISEVQREIDAMPNEKAMVESYDKAKEMLERVKKAAEKYNQAEKERLDGECAQKQSKVDAVKLAIDALENTKIELDDESNKLSTDLFEKLDKVMASLQNALPEHRAKLDEVIKSVDTLNESLTACVKDRNAYKHWFDAQKNVVESMAVVVGADYPHLKETMDLAKTEKIEPLLKTIEDSLIKLDELLSDCLKEANRDQKELDKQAVNLHK